MSAREKLAKRLLDEAEYSDEEGVLVDSDLLREAAAALSESAGGFLAVGYVNTLNGCTK